MSMQTQQFRVVGVNTQTGEDVSVIIDAGTKAAAEVKAEKMHIDTTHIVRLKADTPEPPDEHELFSSQAAEALIGTRTINLIEEVVPQEEPKPAPPPPPAPEPVAVVTAITRPNYAAPSSQREARGADVSGLRAFGIVLIVLLGMSAGAYFVLVQQPNTIHAQDDELVFGQDLFSDVLEPATIDPPRDNLRDAFNQRSNTPQERNGQPIAPDQQLVISKPPAKPASPDAATPTKPSRLKLQSVVTTNQGRFAVINGKLYEQGGSIGSAKLVSVADDWVLIERDGKQFTLKIQQSTSK